ncbi:MAG: hypothetical protein E6Q97_35315 [Desulfurellales bacterium]|nr:MAG: hypothetical protein E6Q97_35315 [Desulfurellales bacterium]
MPNNCCCGGTTTTPCMTCPDTLTLTLSTPLTLDPGGCGALPEGYECVLVEFGGATFETTCTTGTNTISGGGNTGALTASFTCEGFLFTEPCATITWTVDKVGSNYIISVIVELMFDTCTGSVWETLIGELTTTSCPPGITATIDLYGTYCADPVFTVSLSA